MNERIKELALEAKLGPALLLHHWGKIDALTDSEQEDLEKIEKFAQSIVRECALVVHKKTGPKSALNVLEHFGVEE